MLARSRTAPVVFLVLLLAACGPAAQEYTSEEGGFTVTFPGRPSTERDPDLPEEVQHVRLVQRSGNYTVAWQDLAKDADRDPEERLDRACNGALRALEATQLSRKAIRLEGKHPGRELVAGWEGREGRVRSRFFLVAGKLYQVVVTGPKWWVESAAADRFLESFRLLEK